MTRAVFTFTDGRITAFEVRGHTGEARRGKDILCAFISGAVETAINTLTDSFGIGVKLVIEEGDASVCCRLDSGDINDARIFDRTANGLRLSLLQLSERYPRGLSVSDTHTGQTASQ